MIQNTMTVLLYFGGVKVIQTSSLLRRNVKRPAYLNKRIHACIIHVARVMQTLPHTYVHLKNIPE